MSWDVYGRFWMLRDVLKALEVFWDILGHFVTFWDVFGRFGTI